MTLLESIGLRSLVKTTGGYGLHVFVPLAAGYSYDDRETLRGDRRTSRGERARRERHAGAHDLEAAAGRRLHRLRAGRSGKTIVAPYSVRARDAAPVSTPLHWDEVEAFARRRGSIAPDEAFAAFDMATTPKRLAREGDLWGPKLWKKQRLEPAIAKAQRLWSPAG